MLLAVFFLALACFATWLYSVGELQLLENKGVSHFRQISGYHGIEDIVSVNGTLIASSEDRSWLRLLHPTNIPVSQRLEDTPDGALISIGPNLIKAARNGRPARLSRDQNFLELRGFYERFHPHGIDVHHLSSPEKKKMNLDAEYLVATINNKPTSRGIELFAWSDTTTHAVDHITTIHHSLFRWINAITMVSAQSFYATNWLYEDPGTFASTMEALTKQPLGYVIFCSFTASDASDVQCKVVLDKLRMPNGISYLPASDRVVVVQSLNKSIEIYEREETTHNLRLQRSFPTKSACDNIRPLGDERLLTACHPKQLTFSLHSAFPNNFNSPSQVLLIDTNAQDDESAVQEIVVVASGVPFSAASVALVTDDGTSMVLGAVHDDGILILENPI
eukprot:gene11279-3319_t